MDRLEIFLGIDISDGWRIETATIRGSSALALLLLRRADHEANIRFDMGKVIILDSSPIPISNDELEKLNVMINDHISSLS